MSSLRISVVTAVLDRARVVGDCLQSVLEQTHPEVEHVVIDGGSTDGTLDIVRANSGRVAHLVSERDGGLYEAINKGLAAATGDVIGILGADDVYASRSTLALVAAAMQAGADACFGDLVYIDDQARVVRTWRSSPFRRGRFLRGWMPPHPTFFVRRSVYARLGGYDTRFRIAADYELMLRYLEGARIPSVYVPQTLVRMRVGGTSNRAGNLARKSAEDCLALLKNGYASAPLIVVLKNLRKLPQLLPR